MKNSSPGMAALLLSVLLLAGCQKSPPMQSSALEQRARLHAPSSLNDVVVDEYIPLPESKGEVVHGERPSKEHVWVPGYWERDEFQWLWQDGRWEIPPDANAHWQAGHWQWQDDQWHWKPAHWAIDSRPMTLAKATPAPKLPSESVSEKIAGKDHWVAGHWNWDGHWNWTPGYWANKPHPDAEWVPGHWDGFGGHGQARWVDGHWRMKNGAPAAKEKAKEKR